MPRYGAVEKTAVQLEPGDRPVGRILPGHGRVEAMWKHAPRVDATERGERHGRPEVKVRAVRPGGGILNLRFWPGERFLVLTQVSA